MTIIWILSLWLDGFEPEPRNKSAMLGPARPPSIRHHVQQTAEGIQLKKAVFLYKTSEGKRFPRTIMT